jgi:hypothetical protein
MRLLDDYAGLLDQLQDRHERAQTASELFGIIGPCIPLARAASNMQAALQSARDAVPEDAWLIDQRDRAVELARGFELLLADSRLALAAEEQARATQAVTLAQRKLNVIAALTFPLMAIGAAFGMNLHSGVETVHVWLFWAVIAAGVMLGLLIKAWVGGPSVRKALAQAPAALVTGKPGKGVAKPKK